MPMDLLNVTEDSLAPSLAPNKEWVHPTDDLQSHTANSLTDNEMVHSPLSSAVGSWSSKRAVR